MENRVKVGDILYGMWYCTMHYPVFFKVTNVTGKRALADRYFEKMVRPTDGGYGQQGYVVIDESRMVSSGHIVRLGDHGLETGSYRRYNHYNLEKWDGEPIYADYMD